jgi:hypothetical protein
MTSDTEAFHPGMNAAEFATFKWLVLGHALFAGAVWFGFSYEFNDYTLLTPLFGLPLAVMGPRERRVTRALVLLIGLTLIHWAAWSGAVASYTPDPNAPLFAPASMPGIWQFLPGAVGGLIGAAGSFSICLLTRLAKRDGSTLIVCAVGTLVLSVFGAMSVSVLLDAPGDIGIWQWFAVYTPWQLAFGYFLARLLR